MATASIKKAYTIDKNTKNLDKLVKSVKNAKPLPHNDNIIIK